MSVNLLPACRRLLFPLLEIGDVCTQASLKSDTVNTIETKMQFKCTEGEGREGEIVGTVMLPAVQSICPDICIHELTRGGGVLDIFLGGKVRRGPSYLDTV